MRMCNRHDHGFKSGSLTINPGIGNETASEVKVCCPAGRACSPTARACCPTARACFPSCRACFPTARAELDCLRGSLACIGPSVNAGFIARRSLAMEGYWSADRTSQVQLLATTRYQSAGRRLCRLPRRLNQVANSYCFNSHHSGLKPPRGLVGVIIIVAE